MASETVAILRLFAAYSGTNDWETMMTDDLHTPPISNDIVWFRPIQPEDYGILRTIESSGELGLRWRFRGTTPTPEQWAQSGSNAMVQFIVMARKDNESIGLVSLHDTNFQDGHASVSAAKFSLQDRSLKMMSALLLFLDYAFRNWRFRKLYFEVPEYNLDQFGSAIGEYLNEEARLVEHIYLAGRYWDRITLSMFERDWPSCREHFAALIGNSESDDV